MNNSTQKILIIHTAFIGDIVLLTPLVETLLSQLKNITLHVLVNPLTKNILEHHPKIDRIIIFDKKNKDKGAKGFVEIARQLAQEKYDIVLSPHRSFKSALLAYSTKAHLRIGFNTSAGAFLFNRKVSYLIDAHEIDRNLSFATALSIHNHKSKPVIYTSENDSKVVDQFFIEQKINSAPLIAIAPGSIWATKRWPKKYYKNLAETLCLQENNVILLGSSNDSDLCQYIAQEKPQSIIDTAGRFSLTQAAELLKRCRLLVSNDSAPMHMATAVDTPVIAIFGPTVKSLGFYPRGEKNSVIEKDLDCRPCGKHGGNSCPINTFECMNTIGPEYVVKNVMDYLAKNENP
jgi:heptosyltransferase II